MRVGVYVDAFNLYHGGRLCGRGTPGWRWLDIRALAESLVAARKNWSGATVDRVIYCTARVDGSENPSAQRDQDVLVGRVSFVQRLTGDGLGGQQVDGLAAGVDRVRRSGGERGWTGR